MPRPLRRAKDMSAQLAVAEVEGKRFESEKKVPETPRREALGVSKIPRGGGWTGWTGLVDSTLLSSKISIIPVRLDETVKPKE